jgi:3-deoxy-D-manno-octulosonate 8-phosphate phosphatase (KDO 8-P phosphatase)
MAQQIWHNQTQKKVKIHKNLGYLTLIIPYMNNVLSLFSSIKAFVFDVDGVMTDGQVHVLETGEHYRSFFIRDGYAIEKAREAEYSLCVISGGGHLGVKRRLENLKFQDIYMSLGGRDKLSTYLMWLEKIGISEDEILYMGDDTPDLHILKRPKLLSTCPADAIPEIKSVVKYVSPCKGGQGAVRDVIEKVMKLQGKWPE